MVLNTVPKAYIGKETVSKKLNMLLYHLELKSYIKST